MGFPKSEIWRTLPTEIRGQGSLFAGCPRFCDPTSGHPMQHGYERLQ